jgi:hypothetical protein
MLRSTWTLSLMTVLTATALVACGTDPVTTETGTGTETGTNPTTGGTNPTTTMGESGTGEPMTTTTPTTDGTTTMPADTAADGEACAANGDCASQACLKYRDLDDGECVAAADGGNTRIAGTLIDFATGMPVANTELRVIGALEALTDPVGAVPAVTVMSDASGQVDATSAMPLSAGIGIVGIVSGGDYYTTATGLASPTAGKYGPMNGNRDIWAVPSAKLTEWSGYLATDADIMPSLPLGEKGGVVGFVRDTTGAARAGAKVVSVTNGDATMAKIRYLADDGLSFAGDVTGATGIFILVSPALAERFTVEGSEVEGTAGSAENAAFVMILTVP